MVNPNDIARLITEDPDVPAVEFFSPDFRFEAIFTGDADMPSAAPRDGQLVSVEQIVRHMSTSDTAAVILLGSTDDVFGAMKFDEPIWVAHTANPSLFYASSFPPTEPDDVIVEGEDLLETLRAATVDYYS